ncbi:MAG: peptidoglycan DD-metalloendopeptidase family protein [Actinobacteria bacterium]|nr:peptidoglycan DD-metalloendopeptidase family protein [Actinomycetota bacterium]
MKAAARPAAALVAGLLLLASPVLAGTEEKVAGARQRLAAVQKELDVVAAEIQAAYDDYQATRAAIEETRASIARVERRIQAISDTLAARAREAYTTGPAGTIHMLLSSVSFTDFSDRVEFLDAVQADDASLVIRAQVNRERLARERAALADLSRRQAEIVDDLEARETVIAEKFAEIEDLVDTLTERLRKEKAEERRQKLLNIAVRPAGAGLQTCPVAGPNSFVDSWGAPRSGGRTHQGTDLLAAFGTPVVAAQTGSVRYGENTLGGLSAYVTADNGDFTYYAHLSSFGPTSGHVSAGTIIGHVGSTGNAGEVNHLHFEYHPGNRGPVNPYPFLLEVC